MKHIVSLLSLAFLFSLAAPAQAQRPIQEVRYEQGKIIGSLPYGRHFYVVGSTRLPQGARADKVEIKIWDTGRYVTNKKRNKKPLTADETASILAQPPMVSASWFANQTDDTTKYKLYIDQPLEIARQHMIELTIYEKLYFDLSEAEKDEIIDIIVDDSFDIAKAQGGIAKRDNQNIINKEVRDYLNAKDYYSESFTNGTVAAASYRDLPIGQATISEFENTIGRNSATFQKLQVNELLAEEAKEELKETTPGTDDFRVVMQEIDRINADLRASKERIDSLREELPELLVLLREKLVTVYTDYIISYPEELNVAALEAIRIGTAFGGGLAGLNFLDVDNRDYDVFGYTALKFYLSPVDKRVANPYMSDRFFINRLAIMVGFSVTGDLEYNGVALDRALGFYPVAGLSYDLNRYMSIDIGGTMFKQRSLSPLTNDSNIRFAPLVGLNFDADLFNRMKAIFTGSAYNLDPNN